MDPTGCEYKRDGATANRASQLIRSALGYVIAAVCLLWLFHDIRARDLLRYISRINWWWAVLAITADLFSYGCQAWRWHLLLKPIGKISVIRSAQAIYAGLFASEVLPMRFGEFVRGYLVSRWLSTGMSAVVPSMLIERLFDGILLTIGVGLAVSFVSLPKDLREAGDLFAVLIVIGIATFVYLLLPHKRLTATPTDNPAGETVIGKLKKPFLAIVEGLRKIRSAKTLSLSFAASTAFLVLQILSFWLMMRAYGLNLSVLAGGVVFLVVHLGTAIPNAPANIGTYQFFTVVGLALFGVDKTFATSFSVMVFFVLTVPLWLIGFLALAKSGHTLIEIRNSARHLRSIRSVS